jgi:glycosyltransferase involved in cell wall biosynthesis
MSQRRVLHLIHGFLEGGSEHQMIQLTGLLHQSGQYKVYAASLSTGGLLREEIERLGIRVTDYPLTSFYDRNMLNQLWRCARFLKAHQVDIVHTHDFYSNIFGMIAAALIRVPARIASRRETTGTRSSAQKRVERYAFRLAHTVIANAAAVQKQLITEGVPAEKILTIYNGIDKDRFTSTASDAEMRRLINLTGTHNRRLITLVANFNYEVKDQATFLRAARRVLSAVPEAAFVFAGEGALKETMQKLAEDLGVRNSCFFLGRCARVPELLALSEICVLSSKAEGFSNSILEYMAAARPVVATNVGGASEAIVDGLTGYLVPAGNDEQMAERITSLLREPKRGTVMGANGRRVVEDKFSTEARLISTIRLYERLLNREVCAQ